MQNIEYRKVVKSHLSLYALRKILYKLSIYAFDYVSDYTM